MFGLVFWSLKFASLLTVINLPPRLLIHLLFIHSRECNVQNIITYYLFTFHTLPKLFSLLYKRITKVVRMHKHKFLLTKVVLNATPSVPILLSTFPFWDVPI